MTKEIILKIFSLSVLAAGAIFIGLQLRTTGQGEFNLEQKARDCLNKNWFPALVYMKDGDYIQMDIACLDLRNVGG